MKYLVNDSPKEVLHDNDDVYEAYCNIKGYT
jgi:hypothetical protein